MKAAGSIPALPSLPRSEREAFYYRGGSRRLRRRSKTSKISSIFWAWGPREIFQLRKGNFAGFGFFACCKERVASTPEIFLRCGFRDTIINTTNFSSQIRGLIVIYYGKG